MSVKALIGFADQLLVKCPFASTGLVAGHQQDCLAARIERESNSPFTIRCTKSQLLHVRVPRAVQRIDTGSAQLRPELLKKSGQSENFRLDVLMQASEFRLEFIADLDGPRHLNNMH